jgi:hypothetical protein
VKNVDHGFIQQINALFGIIGIIVEKMRNTKRSVNALIVEISANFVIQLIFVLIMQKDAIFAMNFYFFVQIIPMAKYVVGIMMNYLANTVVYL